MSVIGYVLLTRREDTGDDWLIDHIGEPTAHAEAVSEAARWGHDNPGYEVVVAAVVMPEEDQ